MNTPEATIRSTGRRRRDHIAVVSICHTQLSADAFWRLWRDSEDLLRRRARRMLHRHEEDAEDALSIARLKAARSLESAPGTPDERARWLMRILCNACIDIHRERLRAEKGAALARHGHAHIHAQSTSQTEEERLHRRRALRSVLFEGARLPPNLQRPLFLRAVLDWSYSQIGGHLGITEANARKRVQLAREELLRRLREREVRRVRGPSDVCCSAASHQQRHRVEL